MQPLNDDWPIFPECILAAWEANFHDLVTTPDILVIASGEETIQVEELPDNTSHFLLMCKGAIPWSNIPIHLKPDHKPCCYPKTLPDLGQVAVKKVVVAVEGVEDEDFFVESKDAAEDVELDLLATLHGKYATGFAWIEV